MKTVEDMINDRADQQLRDDLRTLRQLMWELLNKTKHGDLMTSDTELTITANLNDTTSPPASVYRFLAHADSPLYKLLEQYWRHTYREKYRSQWMKNIDKVTNHLYVNK